MGIPGVGPIWGLGSAVAGGSGLEGLGTAASLEVRCRLRPQLDRRMAYK
jgi:hypothetical protein